MEDDISKMKGAGRKKGEKLYLAGIESVNDLKAIGGDALPDLKERCAGISVKMLNKWKELPAHPGACPHKRIDYRKTPNPYLANYGIEDWETKCMQIEFMKKYICVKQWVHFLERIMKKTCSSIMIHSV